MALLTLEEVSRYLPHGVQVVDCEGVYHEVTGAGNDGIYTENSTTMDFFTYDQVKLVLRPVEDLVKVDKSLGGTPIKYYYKHTLETDMGQSGYLAFKSNLHNMSFIRDLINSSVLVYFEKQHYDFYDLIKRGLAIEKKKL